MFGFSPLEMVTWGFAVYLAVYGAVTLGFISRDRVPERTEWWILAAGASLPSGAGILLAACSIAIDSIAASFPDYAQAFEGGRYSALTCAGYAAVYTVGTVFFLAILGVWARWKRR